MLIMDLSIIKLLKEHLLQETMWTMVIVLTESYNIYFFQLSLAISQNHLLWFTDINLIMQGYKIQILRSSISSYTVSVMTLSAGLIHTPTPWWHVNSNYFGIAIHKFCRSFFPSSFLIAMCRRNAVDYGICP